MTGQKSDLMLQELSYQENRKSFSVCITLLGYINKIPEHHIPLNLLHSYVMENITNSTKPLSNLVHFCKMYLGQEHITHSISQALTSANFKLVQWSKTNKNICLYRASCTSCGVHYDGYITDSSQVNEDQMLRTFS